MPLANRRLQIISWSRDSGPRCRVFVPVAMSPKLGELLTKIHQPSGSTVLLAMRRDQSVLSHGSGVIYEKDGAHFIATAWHNLSGRHSYTLSPLATQTLAIPNNVVVTFAQFISGQVSGWTRLSFVLSLVKDDGAAYMVHPERWPRADVAVLPIDLTATYTMEVNVTGEPQRKMGIMLRGDHGPLKTTVQAIQQCLGTYRRVGVPPENLIHPGDELFILGYPRGITDHSVEPIWKRATVASDPHRGWDGQSKFLVDCASREGMSGAPVISYNKRGTVSVGGMTHVGSGPAAALQGIYVGRLIDPSTKEEDRLFEAQIGTVWKASVIEEIIEGNLFDVRSDDMMAGPDEVLAAIVENWPDDGKHHDRVMNIKGVDWGTAHNVLKALGGNANPFEVRKKVIEFAKAKQAQVAT